MKLLMIHDYRPGVLKGDCVVDRELKGCIATTLQLRANTRTGWGAVAAERPR